MKRFLFILLAVISVSISFPQIAEASNQSTAIVNQERTITGKVTDKTGEPLIGASILVYVNNEAIGVTTDVDGRYSVRVPAGRAILRCSFPGYTTFEIELPDNVTILDIILS